jgi:hypothetical protein
VGVGNQSVASRRLATYPSVDGSAAGYPAGRCRSVRVPPAALAGVHSAGRVPAAGCPQATSAVAHLDAAVRRLP